MAQSVHSLGLLLGQGLFLQKTGTLTDNREGMRLLNGFACVLLQCPASLLAPQEFPV